VLHPLEFAALLAAARTSGPNDHALVCLLGMLGLRISEACAGDITDIRDDAGYEVPHVLGKGVKPADIPDMRRSRSPAATRMLCVSCVS
jgi:integrase